MIISPVAGNITHPIHSLSMMIEIIAPTNGAKLKRAPVLREPKPLSALMKNTKLTPKLNDPSNKANTIERSKDIAIPRVKASDMDIVPATNPFILPIWMGSLSEILQVRLLSIPQQTIAKMSNSGPIRLNSPLFGSQVKNIPATVMHANANHIRFPAFSLKIKMAIMAVASPSKLSNNEAEKPETKVNPTIILIGPSIPPVITAPASHGKSFLSNGAAFLSGSVALFFLTTE